MARVDRPSASCQGTASAVPKTPRCAWALAPGLVALLALLTCPSPSLAQAPALPDSGLSNLVHSITVDGKSIDTKTYLNQCWEARGRAGLVTNGNMTWDAKTRQWSLKSTQPDGFAHAIAHYGGFTSIAGALAVNIAATYHEVDLADELAKFYSVFLHSYFTTLGGIRNISAPEIKMRQLGPEWGPDSTRTLVWWQDISGGVLLRECYLCNEEYFVPVAALVEVIAKMAPAERTPAMNQFVAEYLPVLVTDHLLRLNFADLMRKQMIPGSTGLKRPNMSEEEIGVVTAAARVLGAYAADPKLVNLSGSDRDSLKDLVHVGVQRFQASRALTTDAQGRICATYFAGDYDFLEDFDYVGYHGARVPTPADKAKGKGTAWDIDHFNVVPVLLRALYDNRAATGVDFPKKIDLEFLGNQYAYHVFEGDYKKPLFTNYFDGQDGWYRVGYLGREGYGVAPSHYCSTFDRSHSCATIGAIYGWGLLAALHPGIAKVDAALVDLARSHDPVIACFQPQCFRERYYRYLDSSFSFIDSDGQLQYPPALMVVVSQLVLSISDEGVRP